MNLPNFGPKTGILQVAWKEYNDVIIPKEAGDAQRIETMRGFYSGAMIVMATFAEIGNDGTSETAGIIMLASIQAELDAYKEHLQKLAREGKQY